MKQSFRKENLSHLGLKIRTKDQLQKKAGSIATFVELTPQNAKCILFVGCLSSFHMVSSLEVHAVCYPGLGWEG